MLCVCRQVYNPGRTPGCLGVWRDWSHVWCCSGPWKCQEFWEAAEERRVNYYLCVNTRVVEFKHILIVFLISTMLLVFHPCIHLSNQEHSYLEEEFMISFIHLGAINVSQCSNMIKKEVTTMLDLILCSTLSWIQCVCMCARMCVCPGWRPRRTIIFASWDAEEFGLLGSTEWAEVPDTTAHWGTFTQTLTGFSPSQQDNAKLLQERAVAYINADSAIEGEWVWMHLSSLYVEYFDVIVLITWIPGMYTLRVDCTPSLHTLVYDLTKQVSTVTHNKHSLEHDYSSSISLWPVSISVFR